MCENKRHKGPRKRTDRRPTVGQLKLLEQKIKQVEEQAVAAMLASVSAEVLATLRADLETERTARQIAETSNRIEVVARKAAEEAINVERAARQAAEETLRIERAAREQAEKSRLEAEETMRVTHLELDDARSELASACSARLQAERQLEFALQRLRRHEF